MMHESPRSDAAGLQTPKKLLRLTRFKGEAIDGVVYLIPEDADTPYAADDPECVYLAGFVDGELAALRARTEGLQQELEAATTTDLFQLLRVFEPGISSKIPSPAEVLAKITALRASHETLQAERDQLQVSIEAFNHHEHDREGAAMVWRDLYEQERSRVTALDAELAEMRIERAEVGVRHWRAVQRAEEAETKLAATEAAIRALVDKWRQAGSDRARHSYVCVTFIACADALLAVLGPKET